MDQLGELLLGRRVDEMKRRCSSGAIEAVDAVNSGQVGVRIEIECSAKKACAFFYLVFSGQTCQDEYALWGCCAKQSVGERFRLATGPICSE